MKKVSLRLALLCLAVVLLGAYNDCGRTEGAPPNTMRLLLPSGSSDHGRTGLLAGSPYGAVLRHAHGRCRPLG